MKRLIVILFILFIMLAFASKPLIAVYGFASKTFSEEEVWGFTSILESALFDTGYFKILEREQLQRVLKEKKLEDLGVVESKDMASIGKYVGAKFVAFGTIERAMNDIIVNIKIVDVNTGEIVFSDAETIHDGDSISKAIKEMVSKIKVDEKGNILKIEVKRRKQEEAVAHSKQRREFPTSESKTWLSVAVYYIGTYTTYDYYYEETPQFIPFARLGSIDFKNGQPDAAYGVNLFLGITYRKYFGAFYAEGGTIALFIPYVLVGVEIEGFDIEGFYFIYPGVGISFGF